MQQVVAAGQGRLVSEQRRVGVGQGPLTILHEAQELLLSPLHGLELEWQHSPRGDVAHRIRCAFATLELLTSGQTTADWSPSHVL